AKNIDPIKALDDAERDFYGEKSATGLAQAIKQGDKALYQFRLPFTNKNHVTVKGEWAGRMIDEATSIAEKYLGPMYRPFLTGSGFDLAQSYSYGHEAGQARSYLAAEDVAKRLQQVPGADDPEIWKLGDAF